MPGLFDTHAHLDHRRFDPDRAQVLARARSAGVERILTVSTDLEAARRAVALAHEQPEVYAAVGVHPSDAVGYDDAAEQQLREVARSARVRAIGEVGLDYHWDYPRAEQVVAFRRQIRLARALGLPLVIHNREADADVLRILQEEQADKVGGVMHCFSGDWALAERCLGLGFHIGLGGPVSYPRNTALREVARRLPADRLLVETDCPFLAPQPRRGQRNEPAYVRDVAAVIAAERGQTVEQVAQITMDNGVRLFGL